MTPSFEPYELLTLAPTKSSSTRVSLIERVLVDDSRAWRDLVELYGPLVAHWCRRLCIPERSVADCVQNVFMAVLKALPDFEPNAQTCTDTPSNQTPRYGFRAWLWGITRHKCLDMMRAEGRHPSPAGGSTLMQSILQIQDTQDDAGESWEEYTEATEITQLLQRAMQQVEAEFEPKTWKAFWRTTVDGLSTNHVASELDIGTAAVRQYRSRVLRRLRKQLGELE